MSQFISMMISSSMACSFMFMKHPMAMGITLLIQTVLICIITNNMSQNAWFSYILFLVFLGGMLVLFIYLTSVASNELFQKSNNMLKMGAMMFAIIIASLTLDPNLTANLSMETKSSLKEEYMESMTMSMFNYPNNIMTTMAVMYLFLTLIVIVKITDSKQGPLRSN